MYAYILLEGLRETAKYISQDNVYHGLEYNWWLPKQKLEALLLD
jgi:hypothetical protein